MELLVAWLWLRQDSHKLQLNSCSCGIISRGPTSQLYTDIPSMQVVQRVPSGGIRPPKSSSVYCELIIFRLSRFDIIATPSSIMTCLPTGKFRRNLFLLGFSICRTVYFEKDCWLVQLPKFRPRDANPTLGIEPFQWKLASSPQTTFHCRNLTFTYQPLIFQKEVCDARSNTIWWLSA